MLRSVGGRADSLAELLMWPAVGLTSLEIENLQSDYVMSPMMVSFFRPFDEYG